MLELEHISFSYRKKDPKILNDISLLIPEGKFISLIGASGSGKTTFLKQLNGLLKPTSGHIFYNQKDIWNKHFSLADLRKKVGYVFQYPEHQLFKSTVLEDVAFGLINAGIDIHTANQKAIETLKWVGLPEECYQKNPFSISGGQRRLAAIADILVMEPEILILDEPAAGLDPKTKLHVFTLLKQLQKERNTTIILVSHSMDDVALYSDWVWVLHEGRIVLSDKPNRVFSQADFLRTLHIGLPEVTDLAFNLQLYGFDFETLPLTISQAAESIINTIEKRNAYE